LRPNSNNAAVGGLLVQLATDNHLLETLRFEFR
jgi:hypothetical protein